MLLQQQNLTLVIDRPRTKAFQETLAQKQTVSVVGDTGHDIPDFTIADLQRVDAKRFTGNGRSVGQVIDLLAEEVGPRNRARLDQFLHDIGGHTDIRGTAVDRERHGDRAVDGDRHLESPAMVAQFDLRCFVVRLTTRYWFWRQEWAWRNRHPGWTAGHWTERSRDHL